MTSAVKEPEVNEEEQRKQLAAASAAQAQRDADQKRFDTLFSNEEEGRQRASLTLAEQRGFDANVMEIERRFGSMTPEERKAYLAEQEKLTPEQRVALAEATPEMQYIARVAELVYVKMSNLPIPDDLFAWVLGILRQVQAEVVAKMPKPDQSLPGSQPQPTPQRR